MSTTQAVGQRAAEPCYDLLAMRVIDERGKRVITREEVSAAGPGDTMRIEEGAIITPLAADLIRERGIRIERVRPRAAQNRKIAVGADHAGFQMKEELKRFLAELGYQYRDFGAHSADPVDYPDFAHAVAMAVASRNFDLGIVIDGAGIGSCMVANKVPGIRAAACHDETTARNSREHNGANVLCLGSRIISPEKMRQIVKAWLSSELTEERHIRRVRKIEQVERLYSKGA